MPPFRITAQGVVEGMPDPPPPGEQRIDEIFAQVDSKGCWQVADAGADDPGIHARTVWIRGQADWQINELIPLLPADMPFARRIDPTTVAVGSAQLLGLTRSEVYQRAENLLEKLTALMNVYSPNTVRRLQVWQLSERRTSGHQVASDSQLLSRTPMVWRNSPSFCRVIGVVLAHCYSWRVQAGL